MPDINTLARSQTRTTMLNHDDIMAYLLGPSNETGAHDKDMKPPQSFILSGVRWGIAYTRSEKPAVKSPT